MNKYLAIYNGNPTAILAGSSYEAQKKAAKLLKVKKAYMISIVLVELADGSEVTHSTASIG